MMAAVAAGGDRQTLHELIRTHSLEAARLVKQAGKPNDLLQRLQADPAFAAVDFTIVTDTSQFTGRAAQQVDEFLAEVVEPIRQRYQGETDTSAEVNV